MGKFAVGQPVPRTEDPRLLRGEGRFMDDEVLNRMAHAYILRSPHAHARILSLDTAQAKAAPGDALHVVLTHSHALDLEIIAAVLERGEFGFLGVIGSATKKALFLRRLRKRGIAEGRLARLTCPIGVPGVRDKRPEVIAATVAVQLLQAARTALQSNRESA